MTGLCVRSSLWPIGCTLTIAAICLVNSSGPAWGSPVDVIFTIDQSQTTQSWSGVDNTYGSFSPQTAGSLTTSAFGNFVVSFDPTTDNPTSIQFVGNNAGNNNAYYQLANGVTSAVPGGQPANLAGTTSGGEVLFALQNLVFSLNSAPIPVATTSGLTETYSATNPSAPTGYTVTAGGIVFQTPGNVVNGNSTDYVGSTGNLTTGTWTLTESAPGSGHWQLALVGSVTYTYNDGATTGTLTASGNYIANATYSSNNISNVGGGSQTVTVPGNNPTTGAVTATLPSTSSGGTLTVQQVPGITSLTQAAVTAGQSNPIFALSTSDTSIGAPQIWQVDYTGSLNGGLATLTFDFDPTTIPSGTPLSSLGIWHFNELVGEWQFLTGPIVDSYATLGYDTITIQTGSFSPFMLGEQVAPEPATALLAMTALVPMGLLRFRRKRLAAKERLQV